MAGIRGKSVLITGGGSGVGQAAARMFAEAGAKVVIAGRDEAKLKKTAEGLAERLRSCLRRDRSGRRSPSSSRALAESTSSSTTRGQMSKPARCVS